MKDPGLIALRRAGRTYDCYYYYYYYYYYNYYYYYYLDWFIDYVSE